mmetsp:Transcript_7323/g.24176  ORF Transcript_7323/g.24176 Transcript_7323/m.24176 type:complete len:277 (+) Transcript_7323:431-1261(+)
MQWRVVSTLRKMPTPAGRTSPRRCAPWRQETSSLPWRPPPTRWRQMPPTRVRISHLPTPTTWLATLAGPSGHTAVRWRLPLADHCTGQRRRSPCTSAPTTAHVRCGSGKHAPPGCVRPKRCATWQRRRSLPLLSSLFPGGCAPTPTCSRETSKRRPHRSSAQSSCASARASRRRRRLCDRRCDASTSRPRCSLAPERTRKRRRTRRRRRQRATQRRRNQRATRWSRRSRPRWSPSVLASLCRRRRSRWPNWQRNTPGVICLPATWPEPQRGRTWPG